MAVAERHGFTMPQHTAVLAPLLTYDCQFPAWSIGPKPNEFVPNQLFDAVATPAHPAEADRGPHQPERLDRFVTYGSATTKTGMVPSPRSAASRWSLECATRRTPPTGRRSPPRCATPSRICVINNGLGVDPVNLLQAMEQLGYRPPMMFSLFPAPGPLLGLGATGRRAAVGVASSSRTRRSWTSSAATRRRSSTSSRPRGRRRKLPYPVFETQAAASWNAWDILVAGVKGAGNLDQKAICDSLHANGRGHHVQRPPRVRPGQQQLLADHPGLKQIQNGEWVMVWPQPTGAGRPPAAAPTGTAEPPGRRATPVADERSSSRRRSPGR